MSLPAAGVLPVDKPAGPTSHDVVARARRALGVRRVGHSGTLDPFATGLLLLCVGPATRLSEYLTDLDKTYEATARLGVRTQTDDPEGDVVDEDEAWRGLERADVESAMEAFRGPIEQVPPVYSAKKVGGEAAHRKARRGETVRLEPSAVVIHALEVTGMELPELRFRVRCSSGTYVRALARDLAAALGTGAHLTALRRTRVGSFAVEDALSLEALDNPSAVARALMTPARALDHLPRVEVTPEEAGRLGHGQSLEGAGVPEGRPVRVVLDGELVAVAEARGGALEPRKVFRTPEGA